jgi:hypothetical protein
MRAMSGHGDTNFGGYIDRGFEVMLNPRLWSAGWTWRWPEIPALRVGLPSPLTPPPGWVFEGG